MTENKSITKAAGVVASATMASRVLGFVRDAVIAWFFGAGLAADAFFAALRVSNLFRRLLGEGALTSSFVPVYSEMLAAKTPEESKAFVSRFTTLFSIVLIVFTAVGIVFSEWLVRVMTPGFKDNLEKFVLTVGLTQWMFPYLFLVGLMAVAMGVLNSFRHFFAPAISPVVFNLSIIGCVLIAVPLFKEPVYALAVGVLVGGLLQLLIQLPYIKRVGMMPRLDFNFSDPGIWKVLRLVLYSAIGIGIYQLNIFVTLRFASSLQEGSVSYLYYASRLMELPLGVFGVSLATAALPSLSMSAVKNDFVSFKDSLSHAVRLSNFVCLPATVGLAALALPITTVLFKRGEFTVSDSEFTAYALIFYAIGITPVALSRVFASVFYSLKDALTPVYIAGMSFFVNIVMCYALIGPFKHGGLALATSIAAFFSSIVLVFALRSRIGRLGLRKIVTSGVKSIIASLVMGAVVYFLSRFSNWNDNGLVLNAIFLTVLIMLGIAVYAAICALLKAEEFTFTRDLLVEKLRKWRAVRRIIENK